MSGVCPICSDPATAFFHRKDGKDMLICKACRHVFWADVPNQEELTVYYAKHYGANHNQQALQHSNVQYLEGHLDELLQASGGSAENTSLADYGCSFPLLVLAAARRGFRGAFGIDFDEGALDYGRQRNLTMYSPTQFLSEVKAQSLDILRFSHTLEHLVDPVTTLNSCVGKLKCGGLLYITQPSFPVLAFGPSRHAPKDAVWPEHLHFFSPISLYRMVQSAGLRVVRLFTHQRADEVSSMYADEADFGYAATVLGGLGESGESYYGASANYPTYAGENSVVFAHRPPVGLTNSLVSESQRRPRRRWLGRILAARTGR